MLYYASIWISLDAMCIKYIISIIDYRSSIATFAWTQSIRGDHELHIDTTLTVVQREKSFS